MGISPGDFVRTYPKLSDQEPTGILMYDTLIVLSDATYDVLIRRKKNQLQRNLQESLRFVCHTDMLLCLAVKRKNSYVFNMRTQQMGWLSNAGLMQIE